MRLQEAARITKSAEGRYECNLQPDWCIGDVPNGGYLTSVIHNAILSESTSQPDLIHVSLHFLTKADPGPARVVVAKVKSGRNFSVFHAELRQGRARVVGYVTMGTSPDESGLSLPCGRRRTLPRREGLSPKADAHADFRKISKRLEYFPAESGDSLNPGYWVRFRDDDLHAICIGVLADMVRFPEPLMVREQETGGFWWLPTIALSLHQTKRLQGTFVWVDVGNKSVRNGRMDMDVLIRDEQGDVVAVANHCALIVGSERNLKPKL